jgi:superfamily II DNA or RNA helicase
MPAARHPRARHFSASGLFGGLGSFAELEARIAALDGNKERGDAFEVFAEAYLATQKITQSDEVWPGETLPIALIKQLSLPLSDMGVDGVYRTLDGAHHAYQVKFRSRRPALNWTELSTFMGLADRAVQKLVFTNCDDLPEVMNERRGFVCVRGSDLDRLTASDLAVIDTWLRGEVIAHKLKTPLPYQREALDDIARGLVAGDRATAVMACGSGKTLVALWAAQEMGVKRIIVLLPSLALVRQSLHEWLKETSWPRLRFIAVCSDPTVTSGAEDNLRVDQSDLDFAVTTQADEVRAFMDAAFDGVKVVFSTYQSARVVGEAIGPGQGFDFGIFDEAHKTTGREGKGFSYALEDRNLPIAKRLFMTATPRHYDVRERDKEGDRKLVYSMDVPETYGPIVHTLSFAEAARRGIVCHCKIIISVVTSEMIDADLLKRGEVLVKGDPLRAGAVANQIALQKACEAHDLKKVFSFHASVASALDFTGDSSSSVREHMPAYEALHVSGAMPTAHRERAMQAFRQAERAVISNARCLTEGVDVPAVDIVAFLSPRKSKVDIVQAAGRAIRNAPGKTDGYVLLPLFVEAATGESVEEALARTGFDEAWSVIGALAEQDDVLADIIQQMREERGRRGGFDDSRLREIVEVIGPSVSLEALRDAVAAQIVEYIGVTWDERLGELAAYKAEHGDCRVPRYWPRNPALGSWVHTQRKNHRAAQFPPNKVARLTALGFEWDPYASDWENNFAALVTYKAEHGDCRAPKRGLQNRALGNWVGTQRGDQKAGKLSADKVARLTALGFEWDPVDADWENNFAALAAYKAEHGDCRVTRYWPRNPALGAWVSNQRTAYKAGELSSDKVARLAALEFEWDLYAFDWENKFAALATYKAQHGDCSVPLRWPENPALGRWVNNQRAACKAGRLSSDKVARLTALGFVWVIRAGNS